jgi:DedD protein
MSDSPDVQLLLKKRARRRLIGAIAIAGLAAVVLPMVMDEEPKQQVQDVQIRIPGQDQTPFSAQVGKQRAVAANAETAPVNATEAPTSRVADKPAEKVAEQPAAKPPEKAAEKPVEKKTEKAPEKAVDKPSAKAAEKSTEKPNKANESKAHDNGQYLILIGAFANPANVKVLQTKIGELGIKVITEPLDSPEGKKTRVRAGPFASREAAEKALEKIKRIGVGGVVAAKQ